MLPVTDHDAQDFTGKKIENTGVPQRFQVEHEATVFPLELPISVVFHPFHVPYAFTKISVLAVQDDVPLVDARSLLICFGFVYRVSSVPVFTSASVAISTIPLLAVVAKSSVSSTKFVQS